MRTKYATASETSFANGDGVVDGTCKNEERTKYLPKTKTIGAT